MIQEFYPQQRASIAGNGGKTFVVCLFSKDVQLAELCNEALSGIPLEPYNLVSLDPDQVPSIAADLLIWDVQSCAPLSRNHLAGHPHTEQLFLIGRKHLHEFLTHMPLGVGGTLLKPINRRTLQIFIEQAVSRWASHQNASPGATEESAAKDALQCLLTANLKLQEYDQDRTNFLARAVHDFRAPLMAASGYCSLLLESAMGPLSHNQMDLVGRIRHSVEKLTRMAAAMLQLSAGKHVVRVPDLKEAAVEAPIQNALHEIEPMAREKQIQISTNLSTPSEPLYLEQQQIEQVMLNLLENACKFTPKGGAIEVRGRMVASALRSTAEPRVDSTAVPNAYRVDVIDTGSGILPEHLETVFEEYTCYGGCQDRSGGGLGLAICKMIISAHRGRIWAENTPSGAMLSFILPMGQSLRKPVSALTAERAVAGATY